MLDTKAVRKEVFYNRKARNTAIKMAKYSQNEVKTGKQKVIGFLLMSVFGIFIKDTLKKSKGFLGKRPKDKFSLTILIT